MKNLEWKELLKEYNLDDIEFLERIAPMGYIDLAGPYDKKEIKMIVRLTNDFKNKKNEICFVNRYDGLYIYLNKSKNILIKKYDS